MGWNGLDLINDFSAELGDISGGFKTKVLRWINEGIRDISTSHNWPFLREKGQAVFVAGLDTHPVVLEKAAAPTLTLTAGGNLTDGTAYQALITFYEEHSGVESIAGTPATATPTVTDLSFQLTDIPVSTSPLVTERRVYVQSGVGIFQYHGTIANNLELETYDVATEPTSAITPPDESAIHMLDGDLFIETRGVLGGSTVQNLIYLTSASVSTGTPEIWAPINEEEVMVYPKPSADETVSFFYFKRPARIFGLITSIPQIPSWLYEDLRRYVMWRGYEFRDRAGKESKQINYENGLKLTISRRGKALKRSGKVRCMTPDSDGNVY